jgi:hypothetical protein
MVRCGGIHSFDGGIALLVFFSYPTALEVIIVIVVLFLVFGGGDVYGWSRRGEASFLALFWLINSQ